MMLDLVPLLVRRGGVGPRAVALAGLVLTVAFFLFLRGPARDHTMPSSTSSSIMSERTSQERQHSFGHRIIDEYEPLDGPVANYLRGLVRGGGRATSTEENDEVIEPTAIRRGRELMALVDRVLHRMGVEYVITGDTLLAYCRGHSAGGGLWLPWASRRRIELMTNRHLIEEWQRERPSSVLDLFARHGLQLSFKEADSPFRSLLSVAEVRWVSTNQKTTTLAEEDVTVVIYAFDNSSSPDTLLLPDALVPALDVPTELIMPARRLAIPAGTEGYDDEDFEVESMRDRLASRGADENDEGDVIFEMALPQEPGMLLDRLYPDWRWWCVINPEQEARDGRLASVSLLEGLCSDVLRLVNQGLDPRVSMLRCPSPSMYT